MRSLEVLRQFDPAQLFRLFVDGRFHKKYRGWRGYEENEPGSVRGMLNGMSLMLDYFDLSGGLCTTYIADLHRACMLNVTSKNPKSAPGEMRYQEAGFHFFAGQTTINSLAEVFALRRGDTTPLFHAKGFAKTADELDLLDTFQAIQDNKKLRFRPWYPRLDLEAQKALDKQGTLEEFYRAKHAVQMQFAAKMEGMVSECNQRLAASRNKSDKLLAIARLVRHLELLHPFPDGNCRTFVNLLLQHLLLFHDFYPVIVRDPNLDAEYSDAEFAVEILRGMDNTKTLLKNPEEKLFNYSISEAGAEEKEEFLALARDFLARLDKLCGTRPQVIPPAKPAPGKGIYLNPENLVRITGGEWRNPQPDMHFTGVGSHNTFSKGFLYFGLGLDDWLKKGKDIPTELQRVADKGVRAMVLDRPEYAAQLSLPVLLVDNIERAFKDAAVTARKEVGCQAVLLTGTVGKTGCKVQLHHCLKGQTQVHATLNSANTRVPVLWSLANLKAADQVEINEVSVGGGQSIGSSRSEMVSPDLCLFTSIGPNHMDIHKTLENLIDAKSSVVTGLRPGGVCVVNASDDLSPPLIAAIRNKTDAPLFTFGRGPDDAASLLAASFDNLRYGWNVEAEIEGERLAYFLPLFHQHAPLMSTGVLLTVKKLGYDVAQAARDYEGIEPFETMGRLYSLLTSDGSVLFYDQSRRGSIQGMTSAFNDLHNFNPSGKIVALLGGVAVGQDNEWTATADRELGQLINASKIARLYTTGPYMHHVHDALADEAILVKHSDDLDELATLLLQEVEAGDLLFIMGSAYLYLGRLAAKILNKHQHERLR